MPGQLKTFYSSQKDNYHTTKYTNIDKKGETWKRILETDKCSYFVSDYGHVVKREKGSMNRCYLFGSLYDGELYVAIEDKMIKIAELVAQAFFPETKIYKKYRIEYLNNDALDPSLDNLDVIETESKRIFFNESNDVLEDELFKRHHNKDNSKYVQYQQRLDIAVSEFREYQTISPKYRYFFNDNGEGFALNTANDAKVVLHPAYRNHHSYVAINGKMESLPKIILNLFGSTPKEPYTIEYHDRNYKNVSINNLRCHVDGKKYEPNIGLFEQTLYSQEYNPDNDIPIISFTNLNEAAKYLQKSMDTLAKEMNEKGEISITLPAITNPLFLREI